MDPPGDTQLRRKACEECRRLKLKCDRKFPCHSCMRRGCAAICPSGTFQKGTRSLKTNSLKLHETMTDMGTKIIQLEEALAALQAQVSSEPHPLLEDDSVKVPVTKPPPERTPSDEETDVIDSVGAFSIGDRGEVIFHETMATTDYLLQAHVQSPVTSEGPDTSLSLPPDLILLSVLFPFPPEGITTLINDFISLLPPFNKATDLVELYFTLSGWCVNPIPRADFMRLVFHECYPNNAPAASLENFSSHRLSILFMVFALGSLMDVNRPLCSVEAEEFHTLARACLSIEPVYENSSLYAVQSMHLMTWYYALAASRRTPGYRLAIWGVVIRLCQAIGLHHDTSKLNLDPDDTRLRELVHWEIYSFDFWQAFVAGRPPAATFNASHCKRPYELRAVLDNLAEDEPIVWCAWKHDYIYLLHTVVEQAFRSKGMTYSQILALDQKLRNHPVPSSLLWPSTQEELVTKLSPSPSLAMQCLMRLNIQESGLLHLHRRFFMQALRASPNDPLQHQFGHSVRAVFTTACAVISGLWGIFQCYPQHVRRFPMAWSHGFSAAAALGSLIISAPTCILSPPALNEFDMAFSLFQENQHLAIQPTNAVAVLEDMQRKAYLAMNRRKPLSNPVTDKLQGIHSNQSNARPQDGPQSNLNGSHIHELRTSPHDWQSWPTVGMNAVTDNWRQYATPAGTPLGQHAELPPDDAIHVDIAPEEPTTEHSNWETFIYQFQNNGSINHHIR